MDELTLILNAAEKRLQFILLQDEILLHAEESEPQKNGTDPLLSHINHACRQLGTHPNRIKKIAATAGPGNFMGIRLTAAIAGAFCRANNGMQASINYMQALAYNYFAKEKEIIHIVTAGTRELVHSQCFQYINGMAQALQEIRLIPFEQLSGSSAAAAAYARKKSKKYSKTMAAPFCQVPLTAQASTACCNV